MCYTMCVPEFPASVDIASMKAATCHPWVPVLSGTRRARRPKQCRLTRPGDGREPPQRDGTAFHAHPPPAPALDSLVSARASPVCVEDRDVMPGSALDAILVPVWPRVVAALGARSVAQAAVDRHLGEHVRL